MNFNEFYSYLVKPSNRHLIEKFFGINYLNFKKLETEFDINCGKRKTKLEGHERFIAALLTKQYELLAPDIIKLFGLTNSTATTFLNKIMAFLIRALNSHPDIADKIKPYPLHMQSSNTNLFGLDYKNFDEFYDRILMYHKLTPINQCIITNKCRYVANDSGEVDQDWIDSYLKKPVIEKMKTGQSALMQMICSFTYDIESLDKATDAIVNFSAIVINFQMHHATHQPSQGYGKVQAGESKAPYFYSRSQNKHPFWRQFRVLINKSGNQQCIMPRNDDVFKIITEGLIEKNRFLEKFKSFDKNGFRIAGSKDNDFTMEVAHSGLRQNSHTIIASAVKDSYVTNTPIQVINRLQDNLHLKNDTFTPIIYLNPAKISERLNVINRLTNLVYERVSTRPLTPNVQQLVLAMRRANGVKIYQMSLLKKFKQLEIKFRDGTTCIDIQFYPNEIIPAGDNFAKGVTNAVINFFVALLNHELNNNGLSIRVERRQSFGFNRTSITDTTSMCMRVSLGLEPEQFANHFVTALSNLNSVLTAYNLLEVNNTNPHLKKAFLKVEKNQGKNESDKTGNHFKTRARSNKFLPKFIKFCEDVLAKNRGLDDYINKAFIYAVQRITKDIKSIDQVKGSPIKQPIISTVKSAKDNFLVAGLLNNVTVYAVKMLRKSMLCKEDILQNTYLHIVSKLIKNIFKAESWLAKYEEYEYSHVYAKVILLIEEMLVYLGTLNRLMLAHSEELSNSSELPDRLARVEKAYASKQLKIPQEDVLVYFADNGQQALSVSIACMGYLYVKNTKDKSKGKFLSSLSTKVHVSSQCYYELIPHLKDNMGLTLCAQDVAEFIYVDIREIKQFKNNILKFIKAKVVIIDSTHNPCLDEPELEDSIKLLRDKGIYVVIASSMLKHDQLGTDNEQGGKIILIKPKRDNFSIDVSIDPLVSVNAEFEKISKNSMTPQVASYFQMMNEICRDKIIPAATLPFAAAAKIDTASDEEPAAPIRQKKGVAMAVDKKEAPIVDKKKAAAVVNASEAIIKSKSATTKTNSASAISRAASTGLFKPAAANKSNLPASVAKSAAVTPSSAAAEAPALTFDQRKAASAKLAKIEKETEEAEANEKLISKSRRIAKK